VDADFYVRPTVITAEMVLERSALRATHVAANATPLAHAGWTKTALALLFDHKKFKQIKMGSGLPDPGDATVDGVLVQANPRVYLPWFTTRRLGVRFLAGIGRLARRNLGLDPIFQVAQGLKICEPFMAQESHDCLVGSSGDDFFERLGSWALIMWLGTEPACLGIMAWATETTLNNE